MFSEELKKISWSDTSQRIANATASDVERVLSKEVLTVEDFTVLISPAAEPYLEAMAQLSREYTMQRHGRTVQLYIPLYLSNSCANGCLYCGFNAKNRVERTILSFDEIERELEAIKRLAPFESLLLVTGENPVKVGVEYLAQALDIAKPQFSNLQVEVMPLEVEEYKTLINHGLNGVICFQETYNPNAYKRYHPSGRKSDFEWRVNGFDRMGEAGVHKIGMGILVGLSSWREDATMLAHHLRYMHRNYWRTKYSVNFPRLRSSKSGFQPDYVMSDRELAQLTFAMRIFDRDVDISYSTRESSTMRNNMATLGATTMSAESRTEPGGYATHTGVLEQFSTNDNRTTRQIIEALHSLGREAVFKDWDRSFDFK